MTATMTSAALPSIAAEPIEVLLERRPSDFDASAPAD